MKTRNILLVVGIIVILVVLRFFLYDLFISQDSFSVNTILLKLNIPLKGEAVNHITVKNNDLMEQEFSVYFNNFESLGSLGEGSFVLGAGESKEVEINFKDSKNEVEIYSGYLIVETSTMTKKIPIILGVEDEDSMFVVSQSSVLKYDNVYPGGKFGREISVFDLESTNVKNIGVRYLIKDFNNELVFFEEENLVIKGSFGVTKIVDVPENIPYGDYIFVSSVEYEGDKSSTGYLFSISEKKDEVFSGNLKYFVWVILIFVVGILVLLFYFIKTRDDMIMQLRRQQIKELKTNIVVIRKSEKQVKKIKDKKKKKKKLVQLREIKREIIGNIKSKHKLQRIEFKKLSKRGKKELVKQKLKLWQKQGYGILDTEKKLKKVSKISMEKTMQELKKQNYKIDFLKK